MQAVIDPEGPWTQFQARLPWLKPDPATYSLYHWVYHLLEYMKAKRTLEIGIGRAYGPCVFGMYALLHGGHHWTADVEPAWVHRAEVIREAFGFPMTVLHGDSKAMVWRTPIDFLFIDGGHSYEQVKGDGENYLRWVRKGGFILWHCYDNKRHEVKRAVDELYDPDRYEAMHLAYNSLGVMLWHAR